MTEARRIVVVNDHAFINGGQAKIAVESARILKKQGLDVTFVAGVGPADPRLAREGIECVVSGEHDILSDPDRLRAARQGLWNGAAARLLAEAIDASDPAATVVHVHGWSKALSPSIGPVVTEGPAAHVYTLHEYFLACPNGGFYDYQANRICTARPLAPKCLATQCDPRNGAHKAWRVARQAVLWKFGRLPSGLREIVYLSPKQLAIMAPHLPRTAHLHHLPNPVEGEDRSRIRAEENSLVLFIGRLSPEKGAEVAAAAARKAGMPIAFAGTGERDKAIQAANADAIMLGWLDADQLECWMARARCVVFPSLWYETYGLVVDEALRRGLPVLVSDSSVASDLVRHGESGLLVEAGTISAWEEALLALADDRTVARMSLAAHAAGMHIPDYTEYSSRLVALYDTILLRNRRVPTAVRKQAARPRIETVADC